MAIFTNPILAVAQTNVLETLLMFYHAVKRILSEAWGYVGNGLANWACDAGRPVVCCLNFLDAVPVENGDRRSDSRPAGGLT